MPLRFVLDEHPRGPLWRAILRHNIGGRLPIDATRVGDVADLPLGATDNEILAWAERERRIVLSFDAHTMPAALALHLQAGHSSPGVPILAASARMAEVIDAIEFIAHAGYPGDFEEQVGYVP